MEKIYIAPSIGVEEVVVESFLAGHSNNEPEAKKNNIFPDEEDVSQGDDNSWDYANNKQ